MKGWQGHSRETQWNSLHWYLTLRLHTRCISVANIIEDIDQFEANTSKVLDHPGRLDRSAGPDSIQ